MSRSTLVVATGNRHAILSINCSSMATSIEEYFCG